METYQFWGLLLSAVAVCVSMAGLGIALLRILHNQNRRIDDLRERAHEQTDAIYAKINKNREVAEQRFATKDSVREGIEGLSKQLDKMDRRIEQIWHYEQERDRDRRLASDGAGNR
ncbi:hypothetical protein [Fodinicurvata fenggangensis]|uniref:hypothetical protein n=1 Tax=Fodinicurvata fenggangensis TaxID=1121830 RepID=UPI000479AEFC|nr:hypothetical protein [Fodinicurvata fenggangensis]